VENIGRLGGVFTVFTQKDKNTSRRKTIKSGSEKLTLKEEALQSADGTKGKGGNYLI